MIDPEIQQWNRKLFANTWEVILYMFGNGDSLAFPSYNRNASYSSDADALVRDMVFCAAADDGSSPQQLVPKLAKLVVDLATEALRLEDTSAYGEIQYETTEQWLWSGRMFTYSSLAYAHWFLNRHSPSEWWLHAAKAFEQYYLAKRYHDRILVTVLPLLFMSGDYAAVRETYLRYAKSPFTIERCTLRQLRKLSSLVYLCAEYELHGRPVELAQTLERSIATFYGYAQDWRIQQPHSMLPTDRMIVAHLHGVYLVEETDPVKLAQGLRGF